MSGERQSNAERALERALGYAFDDRKWLQLALTHSSYSNEHPEMNKQDNERLEFLGDAVIELVVSSLLFANYPTASEGELSRRRADVVCEGGLADVARQLSLGDALRLGRGEEKSGGRGKPRLLSSALEACVGAIFIDGGEQQALQIVRKLFRPKVETSQPGTSDYKSRLQEHVQAEGHPPPTYRLVRIEGPDHDSRFYVAVTVDGDMLAEGDGRSKLEAEQAAAELAFTKITAA